MRVRSAGVAAFAAVAAMLTGCSPVSDDGPRIVVTTGILGDVVEQVVGNQVRVDILMPPGADPHSFEISASEAAGLREADLVVSNGLGLEEGLEHHVSAAADEGVPVFAAGDHVEVLEYSSDDASGADPHFWTDPAQMGAVVAALPQAIDAAVDGIDVKALQRGADEYLAELDALDDEMAARFAEIPEERRNLVTNHHVFGYLAEAYDFEVLGAVVPGGTTLAAPSARDLDDLVGAIERAGVATIFADSSQPDRLVQVLADEADLDVSVVSLYTESLGEAGSDGETYLQMVRSNAERIVEGLSRNAD